MFTGIIQEIGEIKNIKKSEKSWIIDVSAKTAINGKKIGQSIAVNGVCVTIIKFENQGFKFEAINETLEISNLSDLKIGDKVNLEAAMKMGDSLDGHLVQGHVDCTGIIENFENSKEKSTLSVKFPEKIGKYLSYKGSITINGVSLTISDLQEDTLSVELIPHTIENTNLSKYKKGDKVNLETDLIAKHLERLLNHKSAEVRYEFLKERNLI